MRRGIRVSYGNEPPRKGGLRFSVPPSAGGTGGGFDPDTANAVVSGAGEAGDNGIYVRTGDLNGKAYYTAGRSDLSWDGTAWTIFNLDYPSDVTAGDVTYRSPSDTAYPWEATGWETVAGPAPAPTVTHS